MKKVIPLIFILAIFATGCSTVDTAPDQVALHYKGGAFSDQQFNACVPNGTRQFNGPGDIHIVFPTNQRSYDASGAEGAERGPFTVVSDDSAELSVPVSVTFTLKSDCETLRRFHETVANKYGAALNSDGTPTPGWNNMLHFIIGKPLDVTLDRISQGYDWRQIWNDEKVRVEYEQEINRALPGLVAERTGDEQFFDGFSALVQKPDPVDPALKAAIIEEQSTVADARAKEAAARAQKAVVEAEAAAAVAKAEAEVAVSRATAEARKAEIAPYGSPDAYNKSRAVENGINPWQPTIIYGVPQNQPQGPEGK